MSRCNDMTHSLACYSSVSRCREQQRSGNQQAPSLDSRAMTWFEPGVLLQELGVCIPDLHFFFFQENQDVWILIEKGSNFPKTLKKKCRFYLANRLPFLPLCWTYCLDLRREMPTEYRGLGFVILYFILQVAVKSMDVNKITRGCIERRKLMAQVCFGLTTCFLKLALPTNLLAMLLCIMYFLSCCFKDSYSHIHIHKYSVYLE